MKKKLLLTFLISNSILAFQKIDTTTIKNIRYEWKISKDENDSTLTEILTEYKSGIYKLELPNRSKPKSEDYFIYPHEYKSKSEIVKFSPLEMKVGNVFERNYFDQFGNLDSVYRKYLKNSKMKSATLRSKKKYKRKNKLEYLIDVNGNKNIYSYNFLGNLKQIKQYKDSILHKISYYKNDLLIKESFPLKNKYRKQFFYEYDNRNRLVKKDDDDHYSFRYYYSQYGISKIEKIYKKRNFIKEITTFKYSTNGELKEKNVLMRTKVSQVNSKYVYKLK